MKEREGGGKKEIEKQNEEKERDKSIKKWNLISGQNKERARPSISRHSEFYFVEANIFLKVQYVNDQTFPSVDVIIIFTFN